MQPSGPDHEPTSGSRSTASVIASAVLFGIFAPVILMVGGGYPKGQTRRETAVTIATSVVLYATLIIAGLLFGILVLGEDA